MRRLIIVVLSVVLMAQGALGAEKTAKCEITSGNKVVFNAKCVFMPEQGGSFSLAGIKQKPLFDGITVISVAIIEKGVADVRGLTADGINSRWGEAKRSSKDKACWVGEDFKVCAR